MVRISLPDCVRRRRTLALYRVALPAVLVGCFVVSGVLADDADYLDDVRPILKTHCFRCHGPLKAESGLRLDTKSLMLKGGESGSAVKPGDPNTSNLFKRITSQNESRMPPEGDRLSDEAIETLRKWIAAGAKSPVNEVADDPRAHWSYQQVSRPGIPATKTAEWSANPIDAFIARKQVAGRVSANPIAKRHVLLRRVYLDLIGLPPTREELRAFLADDAPDAYLKVVDRLLASSHYGERWGRHWLDVWRYSDWYGFQSEVRFSQKNIWHWRDWTVESLNADKGYDRMVMEMLAGDEITPFDPQSLRATGFLVRNRNTDSREQWVRDAVEHSAKAFQAITMGCVQCHDHPYDPISHDEYYRYRNLFEPMQVAIDSGGGGPGGIDVAGVARIFDRDRNAKTKFYIRGNDKTPDEKRTITPGVPLVIVGDWSEPREVGLPPVARIPHLREPVHQQTLARLDDSVRQAERVLAASSKFLDETRQHLAAPSNADVQPSDKTILADSFEKLRDVWKVGRGQWKAVDSGSLRQSMVDTTRDCYLEAVAPLPADFSLRLRLRITSGPQSLAGVMFHRSSDGSRAEAVLLSADKQRPGLRFFFEYGDERHFRDNLERKLPIQADKECILRIDVLDNLVNVYLNDLLQQTYKVDIAPGTLRILTIGASAELHDLRIVHLSADAAIVPADVISLLMPVATLDRSHPAHLSLANGVIEQSRLKLQVEQAERASYLATRTADAWKYLNAPPTDDAAATESHKKKHETLAMLAHDAQRKLKLANAQAALFKARHELGKAETQLAAAEKSEMAESLQKAVDGAKQKFESAGQQAEAAEKSLSEPSVPKYQGLSGSYGSSSGRRLALAKWMANSANPLTARVAVNHMWLRHFRTPLVGTLFDFGVNGAKPTHPELLDWLAHEFMHPSLVCYASETGRDIDWSAGEPKFHPWSMKHLHRLIVTSRVYRSASTANENSNTADPDNSLLWRMPAARMNAETVRDCVLAVAGTLDRTQGGPDLPTTQGMRVTRRSLYFHHSPADQMPFLKLFDAADPNECYQRNISIVPHQALALLNSELVLVQSRRLARNLTQGPRRAGTDKLQTDPSDQSDRRSGPSTREFIEAAYEHVLSRPVTTNELRICDEFLKAREARYRTVAQAKSTVDGDFSQPSNDPRLHARENLIHALFNHHDFVTIP